MFIQLGNVENLKVSSAKDCESRNLSFNCTVHDELFDQDKKAKIIIPKAILNAKIIKENEKVKMNSPESMFISQKCTLRLDFEILSHTTEHGEVLYEVIEDIE